MMLLVNLRFVCLINIIWETPKIVRIGAKKIIYFKPRNFINKKSNMMDKGSPRNIEKIFINAKYLYSMFIIKFSKSLLYLRKIANK